MGVGAAAWQAVMNMRHAMMSFFMVLIKTQLTNTYAAGQVCKIKNFDQRYNIAGRSFVEMAGIDT